MDTITKKTEEIPYNGISETQVSTSKWDAITLQALREQQPCYKDSVEKLGVVLEDLVNMLDLDGTGINVYLLQYVADARQSLRAILQILDDETPEKSPKSMHKS